MNKSFKIVLLLFIILYSGPLAAQKFGYIDSEYILNKHPDYKVVQEELKKLSEEWKKEAQNLDQEIKELSAQLVPLQSFTQIQDMTILSLSWKN